MFSTWTFVRCSKRILLMLGSVILMLSLPACNSSRKMYAMQATSAGDTIGNVGMTVYVDTNIFGRKNGAAKKMTELHQKYAMHGWTVIDMEPYVENNDLQGFFVTYVKKHRVSQE